MSTDLKTKPDLQPAFFAEPARKEYQVVIDGVIEIPEHSNDQSFFDGLLDRLIEYVEEQGAFAGLSMAHNEYVDDGGELNGEETTQDR